MASRFDPTGYLTFDLGTGKVHTRGGDRVVVLPDAALEAIASAPGAEHTFRALGKALAHEVSASLGSPAAGSTPEDVATHVGGAFSTLGLGAVSFVTWGPALSVSARHVPASVAPAALGALLETLIGELCGQELRLVLLSATVDGESTFAVVAPDAAPVVAEWATQEKNAAAVLARLGGSA
ncbi:MAG: hypothetical protein IT379_12175 [Deltaproteobacteria bacterium]|nr:hypothetical protein [Deltaproteobacteria bacterium]